MSPRMGVARASDLPESVVTNGVGIDGWTPTAGTIQAQLQSALVPLEAPQGPRPASSVSEATQLLTTQLVEGSTVLPFDGYANKRRLEVAERELGYGWELLSELNRSGGRGLDQDALIKLASDASTSSALREACEYYLDREDKFADLRNSFSHDARYGAEASKVDLMKYIDARQAEVDRLRASSPPLSPAEVQAKLEANMAYQTMKADLCALQGFDFDEIERTYGLFGAGDGLLNRDNLLGCKNDPFGNSRLRVMAGAMLGNPRLWETLDADGDGQVSRDEFQSLKTKLTTRLRQLEAEAKRSAPPPGSSPRCDGGGPSVPTPPALPGSSLPRPPAATTQPSTASPPPPTASPTGTASTTTTPSTTTPSTTAPSTTAPSTTPSTSAKAKSLSGAPLEDARTRIVEARGRTEQYLEDLSVKLSDLTSRLEVAEAAESRDPKKIGELKAKLAQTERDLQAGTARLTMLAQLERQLNEMLQNMITMRHQMAMNAIGQLR